MKQVNPFLYQNIDNSNHWIISEIILNQCKQHPKKKIIQFVDGREWSFDDLKNIAFEKAKILKDLSIKQGDTVTIMIDDPIAKGYYEHYAKAKAKRENFIPLFEECYEYSLPQRE